LSNVAARRNRVKKKEWVNGLNRATNGASSRNAELKKAIKRLEKELAELQKRMFLAGFGEEYELIVMGQDQEFGLGFH
jgi:hypothetical protein